MISLDAPLGDTASPRSHAVLWWLIPITVIAIVFRIQYLSEVGYLFDESFCQKMVEFSIGEMGDRLAEDTHPPAYYLVLKTWSGLFGDSPFALRFLSLVFGVLAVTGVFLFVNEAYRIQNDPNAKRQALFAAVTAAFLMALCPLHISWSQKIRMYSMGTALTALSSWLLFRALHKHQTYTRDWACFTTTAILLVYTHYFGMFTLAVEYVFACGYLC
ncbi:MAG: glycosyltransferase family 39 protein, partial [Planctomycetota bacterium]